jgi:hypothetical protein
MLCVTTVVYLWQFLLAGEKVATQLPENFVMFLIHTGKMTMETL